MNNTRNRVLLLMSLKITAVQKPISKSASAAKQINNFKISKKYNLNAKHL